MIKILLVGIGYLLFCRSLVADSFTLGNVTLYGDIRARIEQDWSSQAASGFERDDRLRARVRFRLGGKYVFDEHYSITTRLRTGSNDSQQSPHITVVDFDGNKKGGSDVNFDQWFLAWKKNNFSSWLGRNKPTLWKQNELFWDDDVTVAGFSASYSKALDNATVDVNTGYYLLPVGMHKFSGYMSSGQLVFSKKFNKSSLVLAGGVNAIRADGDEAALLRHNSLRDYTVWLASAQWQWGLVTLMVDYIYNSENYDVTDPRDFVVKELEDEIDAYVLSAKWGSLKEKGDWVFAYYYAHIDALAINSAYAQDDWVRWGSSTQTRASDIKGHEFRLVYSMIENMSLVTRLYLVEAITNKEDGKRFRIDLNYHF